MALQKMTTPKGRARFPKLIQPDEFKGQKKYKVDLVLSADEAQVLETKLQTVLDGYVEQTRMQLEEACESAGNARDKKKAEEALSTFEAAPVREMLHEDYDAEGNPTGNMFLKFNSNYSFVNRKTGEETVRKITVFDAGTPPQKITPANIGPGSELKVNFSPNPYYLGGFKGVSLKINGVQVISLSGGGFDNASAEDLGFGSEDGGFVGSTEDAPAPVAATAAPADDGNPDF